MISARQVDRARFTGRGQPFHHQSCDRHRHKHDGSQGKRLTREEVLLTALQQHRIELICVGPAALVTRVQLDLVNVNVSLSSPYCTRPSTYTHLLARDEETSVARHGYARARLRPFHLELGPVGKCDADNVQDAAGGGDGYRTCPQKFHSLRSAFRHISKSACAGALYVHST